MQMSWHFDPLVLIPQIIAGATLVHTFMPPWEAFSDFPELQKKYKLLVYLVGFIAGNARSTLYGSLSTKDGTVLSPAVIKTNLDNGTPLVKVVDVPGNGKVQVAVKKIDDTTEKGA